MVDVWPIVVVFAGLVVVGVSVIFSPLGGRKCVACESYKLQLQLLNAQLTAALDRNHTLSQWDKSYQAAKDGQYPLAAGMLQALALRPPAQPEPAVKPKFPDATPWESNTGFPGVFSPHLATLQDNQ